MNWKINRVGESITKDLQQDLLLHYKKESPLFHKIGKDRLSELETLMGNDVILYRHAYNKALDLKHSAKDVYLLDEYNSTEYSLMEMWSSEILGHAATAIAHYRRYIFERDSLKIMPEFSYPVSSVLNNCHIVKTLIWGIQSRRDKVLNEPYSISNMANNIHTQKMMLCHYDAIKLWSPVQSYVDEGYVDIWHYKHVSYPTPKEYSAWINELAKSFELPKWDIIG